MGPRTSIRGNAIIPRDTFDVPVLQWGRGLPSGGNGFTAGKKWDDATLQWGRGLPSAETQG